MRWPGARRAGARGTHRLGTRLVVAPLHSRLTRTRTRAAGGVVLADLTIYGYQLFSTQYTAAARIVSGEGGSPDTIELRVTAPSLKYEAGQYMFLLIPALSRLPHPISISSLPKCAQQRWLARSITAVHCRKQLAAGLTVRRNYFCVCVPRVSFMALRIDYACAQVQRGISRRRVSQARRRQRCLPHRRAAW